MVADLQHEAFTAFHSIKHQMKNNMMEIENAQAKESRICLPNEKEGKEEATERIRSLLKDALKTPGNGNLLFAWLARLEENDKIDASTSTSTHNTNTRTACCCSAHCCAVLHFIPSKQLIIVGAQSNL